MQRAISGKQKVMGIAVTPMTARRVANFKANRRAYWSMWIFLAMFLISLFAEVLSLIHI